MPHYNRHSAITGKQQVHWLEFGLELVFPVSHHESITGLSVTGLSLTSTSKISSSSDSFSTQSQNFMKIHPKFFCLISFTNKQPWKQDPAKGGGGNLCFVIAVKVTRIWSSTTVVVCLLLLIWHATSLLQTMCRTVYSLNM